LTSPFLNSDIGSVDDGNDLGSDDDEKEDNEPSAYNPMDSVLTRAKASPKQSAVAASKDPNNTIQKFQLDSDSDDDGKNHQPGRC
jgi:hypothetical protein